MSNRRGGNRLIIEDNICRIILCDRYNSPTGLEAIIDKEDVPKIKRHRIAYNGHYVMVDSKFLLHRIILDTLGKIDHKNRNSLDCRKINLRECNTNQNAYNTIETKRNTSGLKGIHWDKCRDKWKVTIQANKKKKFIGRFDSMEEAAKAYNKAAKKYHKEFAVLHSIRKIREVKKYVQPHLY